ncbi:MAG: PAS domain-containing protein [Deltaproteobacteria bacterium]|nr:PAS domain-containing protein [Deltaproteobacteria bacterium]
MLRNRFPWRLFSRIVLIQAALVIVALGASGIAARYFFKRHFLAQVESQLHVTLDVLALDVPAQVTESWCTSRLGSVGDQALRLTVVGDDGRVLCDSRHDNAKMESHADRPEIVSARATGFGVARRFSSTLNESMIYEALKLPGGKMYLRGAIPLSLLTQVLRVFDASPAVFLVVIAPVTGVFTAWSARRLVFPIGRLLVKARSVLTSEQLAGHEGFDDDSFGELSDLEDSLDSIRRDLEAKAERLNLQREEQATLMSAISDSILAVDLEGAPLFYNSRFVLLFGDGLRQRSFRLWEVVRAPEILDVFRQALKEGRTGHVKAIPFDQEDGRKFFSISVSPLRRVSGDVYGAVGIFHDVTDLKRAEQIRIDFVANVSHELRTPLTAIKGYSDTMAQDLAAGRMPQKEFVEIIDRNTSRLMSLINDLLDISSLESNVDELHKQVLDTEEVTRRILGQMKGVFDAKQRKLELEFDAPTVCADPRRLDQVLINLIDNANKYTPAGGKITLRWEKGREPGEALFKVVDSGPGIPREHHARLFERFYRVDKARSRELGGTGLGLAIVKHIMQRHGGMIWVESEMGRGSAFICKFPGSA